MIEYVHIVEWPEQPVLKAKQAKLQLSQSIIEDKSNERESQETKEAKE